MVGVRAVAVVLAVRLVVLVGVGHQVGQREAVMRDNEVYAAGGPALCAEHVSGAADTRRHRADKAAIAAPEAPDVVAVSIVPLSPGGWEMTGLVAAGADVPGLGDEFQLAQDGILRDCRQQGCGGVEPSGAPAHRGREV